MAKLDYGTPVVDIGGNEGTLDDYKGKVLLIVNTASKCGFTPQFEGLENLFEEYEDRGFTVLGFPCNQFGKQDPGSDGEIKEFCQLNYGVSFPMFSKIEVNGDGTHPLFKQLKTAAPGLLGSKGIKWNFTKFLIGRDGEIITRYASATEPSKIAKDVEKHL